MVYTKTFLAFFFHAGFFIEFSSCLSVKEKSQLESVLQRGDIDMAIELIKAGALQDILGPNNRENIFSKLDFTKLLLSNYIAFINEQGNNLENAPSRKHAFNVVLVPDSSLRIPLVVNITTVKNWGNKTTTEGRKPIHIITSLPDVSPNIVQIILDNGSDNVNTKTATEITPLMCAANSGNFEVVRFLVERGARINDVCTYSLEEDELNGYYAYAKLFSKKKLDYKKVLRFSPLVGAVRGRNVDIIRYLIRKGADVNNNGQCWLVLFPSVHNGLIQMLEELVRGGIDVNCKNMMNFSALHSAAAGGHVEAANILIKNGALLNATDVLGWMPIHVASFYLKNEMIQFLVKSGSTIGSVSDGGYTPLNLVEAGKNEKFLDFLVKSFDFFNQTESYKDLPEPKSDKMHINVVDSVIQLGAPLNHQDSILGWSTLHWAAASGDLEVAKLLVNYGAVVSVRSRMDLTPLETAKYFGRVNVVEFLKTAKDLV